MLPKSGTVDFSDSITSESFVLYAYAVLVSVVAGITLEMVTLCVKGIGAVGGRVTVLAVK